MTPKNGLIIPAVAAALLLVAPAADAQRRRTTKRPARPVARKSGAETGLIGIKLFDTGIRVVQVYGNPDQITAISAGGGGGQPGGAGGNFGGGRPGGFGGGAPGGKGGGGAAPALEQNSPIPPDPMDGLVGGNFQRGAQAPPGLPTGPSGAAGAGSLDGPPGAPGGPGGFPGGPGGRGGAPGAGTTQTADFTRWIYTKNGAKFGFVLDKFNRVIQIEAIGLQNGRVKTSRGISFGSTFSQVIKAYAPSAAPDGYDINGDTVTVKFLTRQRVAFRLSKLGVKQPHVVTGIVVAAGKA